MHVDKNGNERVVIGFRLMTRWSNHDFNNLRTCNFFDLSPFIPIPFFTYRHVNCEYNNNSIHNVQLKVKCHVMIIIKVPLPSYHIVVIDLLHITLMVSMIVMKFIVCFFHCSFTTSGLLSSCTIFMIAHSSMSIIFLFIFLHGVLGATKILVFYVSLTLKLQHLGLLSCHVVFMFLQVHVIYVASYALTFFSHKHYVSFLQHLFPIFVLWLHQNNMTSNARANRKQSRINMLIENEQ